MRLSALSARYREKGKKRNVTTYLYCRSSFSTGFFAPYQEHDDVASTVRKWLRSSGFD
jgi:hypothetical protein